MGEKHNATQPTDKPGRRLRRLNRRQILYVGLLVCAGLTLGVVMIHLVRISGYRPLYTDLSPPDSAYVASRLESFNIGFATRNSGKDIYVDADRVHDVRIALSRDRNFFPSGLLNIVNGVSPAKASGEGELAGTIAALEAIESARINIDNAAFPGDRPSGGSPRISVYIKPAVGRVVTEDDLTAVTNLVARSVPGSKSGSLNIYNNNGYLLYSRGPDNVSQEIPALLLSYQQALENRLEQRAGELVNALIGAGRALIKVSVTLDNTQSEATAERFDHDQAAIKKEHTEYAPGSSYTVPETGAVDYIPPIPTISSLDYEIDKTITKTVKPAGSIERIGVSIMIAEPASAGSGGSIALPPVTEADIDTVKQTVASVLSMQPERGDAITVIPVPASGFSAVPEQPAYRQPVILRLIDPLVRILLLVSGMLLIYLLVVKPLLRVLTVEPIPDEPVVQEEPKSTSKPETEIDDEAFTVTLQDEIKKNPTQTVHIINSWLQET